MQKVPGEQWLSSRVVKMMGNHAEGRGGKRAGDLGVVLPGWPVGLGCSDPAQQGDRRKLGRQRQELRPQAAWI